MSAQAPDRWQEILKIFRDINNQYFYKILVGFMLVLIFALIGKNIFAREPGYDTNIYTEILGVIFTIVVLDIRAEWREEKRRIRDLQERLAMDAGSQSNDAAKRAVDELRHRGWLAGEDGLLQSAYLIQARLYRANLKDANLRQAHLMASSLNEAELVGANLQGANLWLTNLQGADLLGINLKESSLLSANLQKVRLEFANLQEAVMREVNLQEASLFHANLHRTNLSDANLQYSNLVDAQFDETTILPDGSHWTPDTDLTRFTDPNHTNFWRSDNPDSPAYRGN